MAHDVFLSYATDDKPVADAMCATLESRSIRCWISPRDVLPGKVYAEAIIDAIAVCHVLVLVLSSNSNNSPHVMREVERGVHKGIPIIPFRIENIPLSRSLEYFVSSQHWLDALTPPLQQHLQRLAATVQLLLGTPATTLSSFSKDSSAKPENSVSASFKNSESLTGLMLGAYVLKAPIGKGGSGIVYRAWNSVLGQNACVKMFYPITEETQRVEAIFARSVRVSAALNHQSFARMLDYGSVRLADGLSFYCVMDLIEGRNLEKWNRELGIELDAISVRLQIAFDLATALDVAHHCRYFDQTGFEQSGILHGDIKPANIIVRPNNTPVLLDFMMIDIQRLMDRKVMPRELPTREYITGLFGTPGFMAPEQECDGVVTVRSDIYSLGVTFSHLFPARDRKRDNLRSLFRQMTEHDPARRPQSAREVVELIKNIASAEKIPLVRVET